MTPEIKNKLSLAISHLADKIVTNTTPNEVLFWKTVTTDNDQKMAWRYSEDLYSGNAGIILFLLECYKHTGKQSYLDTSKNALERILEYCKNNVTNYYAFYTGRLGVAYICIEMYKVTKDEKYKKTALEIALQSKVFLDDTQVIIDLINGYSGTLLGLLHVYTVCEDKALLGLINTYIDTLLQKLEINKHGIYCDRSEKQVRGLCGFSHGASGIGFVLLELYNLTKHMDYYHMAMLTFSYEDAYYNKELSNWPDFRKQLLSLENLKDLKNKYNTGDYASFTRGEDMNAWCHGAAGIGLARLRAYELSQQNKHKLSAFKAANRVMKDAAEYRKDASPTLCHGILGNAYLTAEVYRITKNKKHKNFAIKHGMAVAERILNNEILPSGYPVIAKDIEDDSLFMGIAGVGLYLLNILNGEKGILYTTVPSTKSVKGIYKLNLNTWYVNKRFPTASAYALKKHKNATTAILDQAWENPKRLVNNFTALGESDKTLKEMIQFDKLNFKIDNNNKSSLLAYIKGICDRENNSGFIDNNGLDNIDITYTLSKQFTLHVSTINYDTVNKAKSDGTYYWLLQSTETGMMRIAISGFLYHALSPLQESELSFSQIANALLALFGDISLEDKERLFDTIKAQLADLIRNGIVLPLK